MSKNYSIKKISKKLIGNSLEEALDCGQRVMLSAYDLLRL